MVAIKEIHDGLKEVTEIFKKYRVNSKALVFTIGRYDLVGIFDAPNIEAMSKTLLTCSSQGLLWTEPSARFHTGKNGYAR